MAWIHAFVSSSVAVTDPDPYVFLPPGSGSGSISKSTEPDQAPDPSIIKQK